jgi:hypothetical protein
MCATGGIITGAASARPVERGMGVIFKWNGTLASRQPHDVGGRWQESTIDLSSRFGL